MHIRFLCPLGHKLVVPGNRAGKKGRCPRCHQRVIVPVVDPQPSGKAKRTWKAVAKPHADERAACTEALGVVVASPSPAAMEGDIVEHKRDDRAGPGRPAPIASVEPDWIVLPVESMAAEPEPVSVRPLPAAPFVASSVESDARPQLPRTTPLIRSWIQPAPPDMDWRRQLPEPGYVQGAYGLALAAFLLACLGALPALRHGSAEGAPAWLPLVWTLVAAQTLFAIWLATLPDWTTVWSGMCVAGASAFVYTAGVAMVWTSKSDQTLPLGLHRVRDSAGGWCAAQLLFWGVLAYACGAVATRWKNRVAFKAQQSAAAA